MLLWFSLCYGLIEHWYGSWKSWELFQTLPLGQSISFVQTLGFFLEECSWIKGANTSVARGWAGTTGEKWPGEDEARLHSVGISGGHPKTQEHVKGVGHIWHSGLQCAMPLDSVFADVWSSVDSL